MREYKGKGTLHFPWISVIKGTFILKFKENGKTTLAFTPEGREYLELLNQPSDLGRFSGESTSPRCTILIDKVYFARVRDIPGDAHLEFDIFHPARIIYQVLQDDNEIEMTQGLSNLLFYGIEATQRNQKGVKDTIRCTFNGKEACLVQLLDFKDVEKHLKEFGGVRTTCKLKVKGKYKDLGSLRELSQNAQFLCSLASGNYVTSMYEDIFKENTLFQTILYPLKTYPFSNSHPLIDISLHGTNEFKEYLEDTYPKYVELKGPLGLPYVIEFFTTSKLPSPLQVQFLLTTTTLECLERYFRDWKKMDSQRSLKRKTRRLLDSFNVPYSSGELEFDYIRNFIIHEGRFPLYCDGLKALRGLRNLVNRLFLAILEYRGKPYYNIVKQKKESL